MRGCALALSLFAILALAGCSSPAIARLASREPLAASGAPAGPTQTPAPTPSPRPTATPSLRPTATPSPRPTATAAPSGAAWTSTSTLLLRAAGDTDDVDAHVGGGFPLTLNGTQAIVAGTTWYRVNWATSGRRSTSWVAAKSVTRTRPAARASASFDALDPTLAAYLSGLGAHVGVEVYDLSRGITFGYNETRGFIVASSVKVPIMCAFLAKLEAAGREPTATETNLLKTMIENSNNNSASALYKAIGDASGLSAYMKKIGVTGLTASKGTWGWSTNTASGMVQILTLLQQGRILNSEHRELAFYYMEHIEKDQQVGVQDTAPAGSTVAMKVGWVNQPNGMWAMNSHGIVTYKGETWIVSVFTGDGNTLQQGFDRARHICETIADDLTGTK